MVNSLVFASHNVGKLVEVRHMFKVSGLGCEVVSLANLGYLQDIPEPHNTLTANALEKVRVVHNFFGGNCFGEDTGLMVAALGGAPGVFSARYAGNNKNEGANIDLLLHNLRGYANLVERKAKFCTVLAAIIEGREYIFEGVLEGYIAFERLGSGGWGYDSVFLPVGYTQSYGQMTEALKNSISHRYKAVGLFLDFLRGGGV